MVENDWATDVADYLRARGLRDVTVDPDGNVSGLPRCQVRAVTTVDPQTDGNVISGGASWNLPYAVVTPRPGWPVSTAHVTLSLAALATLLGFPHPAQVPATPEQRARVALVMNRAAGHPLSGRDLIGDVDPWALAELVAAVFADLVRDLIGPDQWQELMTRLGLVAAGGEL